MFPFSLRQHYLDQVMGMISARHIKAPRILKSEGKYNGFLRSIQELSDFFDALKDKRLHPSTKTKGRFIFTLQEPSDQKERDPT